MALPGHVARWDPICFDEILEAIGRDYVRYAVVRVPGGHPPRPTSPELSALVEAALAGSLKREEGRDVRFTLVYSPESSVGALRFKTGKKLEAEEIRRIAPAVESGWGLGVSRTGELPLGIWGLVRRRSDAVEVAAVAPGRVVVRFGLVNIAHFDGLECPPQRCTGAQLLQELAELLPNPPNPSEEAYILLLYLLQLASATRARGHGGAFLLLPQQSNRAPEDVTLSFEFQPPFRDLAERYSESRALFRQRERDDESSLYTLTLLPDGEPFLEGAMPSRELSSLIASVSQFACVDGAVLLHRDLSVLGMGAIIDDKAPQGKEELWLEWRPGSRDWQPCQGPVKKLGATRHQSAFAFAKEHPGAVAVVCSQDGSITMFAQPRAEERTRVARDIDRALA